jgi:hypothetical protein
MFRLWVIYLLGCTSGVFEAAVRVLQIWLRCRVDGAYGSVRNFVCEAVAHSAGFVNRPSYSMAN